MAENRKDEQRIKRYRINPRALSHRPEVIFARHVLTLRANKHVCEIVSRELKDPRAKSSLASWGTGTVGDYLPSVVKIVQSATSICLYNSWQSIGAGFVSTAS